MDEFENEAWDLMCFFVIERELDDEAILAALPVRGRVERIAPRQHALADVRHTGPEETNQSEFSIFRTPGHTVIAPPGNNFGRTGVPDWLVALSKAFGHCWAFSTGSAPGVWRYEAGREVAKVDELGAVLRSAPDLLGLTRINGFRDTRSPLEALGRLLGQGDVRTALRRGTCSLCTL
jgi:hypothetical protein